ncbi:MAG TPA: beta-ketoacyl synthase chain length factor [Caldimonas sp.]|nr:beta-ketoacyl synthase chain length factor [Caldimonas sp.]
MSGGVRGGMLFIDGIAFWAPTLPGWTAARAAFRGESEPLATPAKRPAPALLAAAERRRAPDTVALALEVAAAAVLESGLDAATLPSVFTSAHGDLAVNDYMCSTLATEPTLISPTKFHNSVHNAAAGYWTIATGCREASTALSASEASFGAGLLEAATQCQADARSVLLVGVDVEAVGALASGTASTGLLACALVLSPRASERTVATFHWSLVAGKTVATPLRSAAARSLGGNAIAGALPLFEAIADAEPGAAAGAIALALAPSLALVLVATASAPVAGTATPALAS